LPIYQSSTAKNATKGDLSAVPIDNINPAITIASDLQLTTESYLFNQFKFGVPEGSKRAPLTVGYNPWSVAKASHRDWLDLLPVDGDNTTEDHAPTLEWKFDKGYEDVQEVNLFVSTSPKNKGLLPWDKLADLNDPALLPELSLAQKKKLLTEPWGEFDDFNPGRIITATWKKDTKTWYWHDGKTVIASSPGNAPNGKMRLSIPDELGLTFGQDYYWAAQATAVSGEVNLDTSGEFEVVAPPNDHPFSSVTVVTHGFNLLPTPGEHEGIPRSSYQIADRIARVHGKDKEGLILRYDKPTGNWVPVQKGAIGWSDNLDLTNGIKPSETNYMSTLATQIRSEYQHRPIILLTEWSTKGESTVPDSGFTEGAADAFFASMVNLDQQLGGKVGEKVSPGNGVYENNGDLRRTQGDLFNSPMHFIGFSRGAVVNSEIVQRLGTYYPDAASPDLQMTTIDPHDFVQEGLDVGVGVLISNGLEKLAQYTLPKGKEVLEYISKLTKFKDQTLSYSDFQEPRVQVWDNISFADNYYQTTNTGSNPINLTPNGRKLENTNTKPYSNAADLNLDLSDFRGFKGIEALIRVKNIIGGAHSAALGWYTGTVDHALERIDNEFLYQEDGVEIQNQKGEVNNLDQWFDPKAEFDPSARLWFATYNFPNSASDEYDSEEGIGTGWHYSYLNGGERPYGPRFTTSTAFDNTDEPWMRGDFAVPTLFNGNFDASFSGNSESVLNNGVRNVWGGAIPGWSYHNGRTDQFNSDYKGDLKYGINIEIFLESADGKTSVPLKNNEIPQVLLDKISNPPPNIEINPAPIQENVAVDLREVDPEFLSTVKDLRQPFIQTQVNRIGYGSYGFETFKVDIPDSWRGVSCGAFKLH
jgi:hypothetical protein